MDGDFPTQALTVRSNDIFTCPFSKENIQRRVVLLFLGTIPYSLNHYHRFQSLRGYTNLDEKHIYRVIYIYNVQEIKGWIFLAGKIYFI